MKLHLLNLENVPIYEQLLLEERLLRIDDRNFCILSHGSSKSIVMGISGKPHELIDVEKAKTQNIPIIKRFSGGGTVFIDENTLFVTFIFNRDMHDFEPFPEKIHNWCTQFYEKVFEGKPFSFRENDYTLEEKKCGGNAQYIKKQRWLHHTSFLWDYAEAHMQLLHHPSKAPKYRQGRHHTDFLCKLKDYFLSKEEFFERIQQTATGLFQTSLLEELPSLSETSRQSTSVLSF